MSAAAFPTTLITLLLFAASAPAQTPPVWKFEKGQILEVERTATQKQTVKLKTKETKQERSSTWHIRLEAKEKKADAFVIVATLTKVEHKIVGATDAEQFDPKLHEKMQGSVFTLTVTPTGRVVEMTGYEDFLRRLADKDKEKLKALHDTFPESVLKEAFADIFGPLPEKEPTWQREYVEPITPFGILHSTAKYEHTGVKKGRDRIEYRIDTKYEAPKPDKAAFFRVVKGTVTADHDHGAIAFDREAGRLVEHVRSLRIHGVLTIEVMDREEPLTFHSETEVKIRVK
jgi:hypothetical protein